MSDTKRRILALVSVAGLVVAGCGSTAATPTPAAATPTPAAATPTPVASTPTPAAGGLAVTFIPKQVNNPYFDAAKTGADKAATELGGTVTQVGPSTAAADAQIPFIQDATTQKVSAIAISADDPDAIVPALTAAKAAGIKIVGYDSSPAKGAYDVFVNQVDFSGVGVLLADWACEEAPNCTGDVAILSAAATATNQNAWIALMTSTMASGAKYANLKLVATVYGNDDPQESTTQAQGLLTKYPDLKVIVAPTTVGILAAAQVVKQTTGSTVKVTGLGFPNDMKPFVADGTAPVFGLWSVPDLGYLTYQIAAMLVKGTITGAPGETFTLPSLNGGKPYTIGADSVVILGPAFRFDKTNVNDFNF